MVESEKKPTEDVEIKKPQGKLKGFLNNPWIYWSLIILLLGGIAALTALVVVRDNENQGIKQVLVPTEKQSSNETTKKDDSNIEVDFESLNGTHFGRMKAAHNGSEAVITYKLSCQHNETHYHSIMHCRMTQLGCAELKKMNVSQEEEEKEKEDDDECLMENMTFIFSIDIDGNFYTTESELFDSVRLAVALYTRHLKLPSGESEGVGNENVHKINSTFAFVSSHGITFEVLELAEDELRPLVKHRRKKRDTIISVQGSDSFAKEKGNYRQRRSTNNPDLEGAFENGLRSMWQGGPHLKIPNLGGDSGSALWGIARYRYTLTNFELLFTTLPNIELSSNSKTPDSCNLDLKIDFSQDKKCSKVIKGHIKVNAIGRLCIWFFCFASVRKADYVQFDFTPVIEIGLKLKPLVGNKLDYVYELKRSHSGKSVDLGRLDVNVLLIGFLVNKHIERWFRKEFYKRLDTIVEPQLENQIKKLLPKPGQIQASSAVMGPLSSSLNQCNNLNTISVQLSKIGNVLQAVPPPFGPNKIACSGNGLIQRVHDGCLHDYGMSRSSDHLEVYCYKGAKRFCLSGELCPWRGSQPAQCSAMFALATCSVGGLSSSAMAVTWGQTRSCWRSCSGRWIFRRCRWNCRCSGARFRVNCNTGSATVSYY